VLRASRASNTFISKGMRIRKRRIWSILSLSYIVFLFKKTHAQKGGLDRPVLGL
jgi:hypothetical protein